MLCGSLVLPGLFTIMAAIPLIVIKISAIDATQTKVFANEGFWAMRHGSRTDWSMLLGSIFLLIRGGGKWSVDKKIYKRLF